jgi:hypothetical protein
MAQHMDALADANRVRFARAELKRRIMECEVSVAEVLADPPREARRMTLEALLEAQAYWGPRRARAFLREVGIWDGRTVEQITARQCDVIARLLP